MKKVLAISTLVLTVLISCKKATDTEPVQIEPKAPKEAQIVEPAGDQCYESTANNNRIELSFNVNSHQEVNGKLKYEISGKDKNDGIINGNMVGDTLIAEYVFMSEGASTMREVVFLQRDGNLIEGYGDVVRANDKVVFKDRKKLKFDQSNTLTKVNCKVE